MLNLYTNITPNLTGTHYYFTDFNKYLTFLSNKLFKQIDNSRYDINKGFIRVKLDNVLTASNYKDVTYIINTNDNICYHVSSQIVQSDYVIYNVKTDLWGSYIKDANIKNINVKKCNRKINDNGILDKINYASQLSINGLGDNAISIDDLYVVFICPNQSVSDEVNIKYGFADSVRNFVNAFSEVFSAWQPLTIVSKISTMLARIRTIYQTIGSTRYEYVNGGKPIKAMIIHRNLLRFRNTGTEPINIDFNGKTTTTARLIETNIATKEFTITPNKNYKYTIGVLYNGIDVVGQTKDINIKYLFYTSSTDLYVTITINDEQKDISHAFIVASSVSSEQQQSVNLNNILGIMANVLKTGLGFISASPKLITSGITGGILGANNLIGDQRNGNTISSSGVTLGADINYASLNNDVSNDYLYTPYKVMYTISLSNEEKILRKTGANFNDYVDNITDIFNYDLLGTGETTDDTYIIAKLDANDIPTSAVTLIENRFNNGIYLQLLQ